MPIQPINYAAIPLLRGPLQGLDFGKILQQGMQLGQEPGRLLRERQQQELSNALRGEQLQQAQAATPYAGEMEKAKLERILAQVKKDEQLAKMGGTYPTGDTGELVQIQKLIDAGDPNGPLAFKNWMSKFNQRLEMIASGPLRWASATGKHAIEREKYQKVLENPNLKGKEKREAQRNLRAIQLKEWLDTASPEAQSRYRSGEQIQKTLGLIDFDAIAKGAGPGGLKWLGTEAGKSIFDKESPEYRRNRTSMKGLESLAETVGNFYGTPAAMDAQNRLRKMLHDPRLLTNPRIMKEEFDFIKKLLHAEHTTFEDSLLYTMDEIQKVDREAPRGSVNFNQNNAKLLKMQKDMAEALKKTQPGGQPKQEEGPRKISKRLVNGKWVKV